MKNTYNPTPGEILKEEFLEPSGLSQYKLAKATGIDEGRISKIVNGRMAITTETAIRLGRYFNQSPRFWTNLQADYEMAKAKESGQLEMVAESIAPHNA
jgi:addiction module HigA family antidote